MQTLSPIKKKVHGVVISKEGRVNSLLGREGPLTIDFLEMTYIYIYIYKGYIT